MTARLRPCSSCHFFPLLALLATTFSAAASDSPIAAAAAAAVSLSAPSANSDSPGSFDDLRGFMLCMEHKRATRCDVHLPSIRKAVLPRLESLPAVVGTAVDIADESLVHPFTRLTIERHMSHDYVFVYNRGPLGCYLSHAAAWRKCVELGVPIVVMEDDLEISAKDAAHLREAWRELPQDYDFAGLYYADNPDFRPIERDPQQQQQRQQQQQPRATARSVRGGGGGGGDAAQNEFWVRVVGPRYFGTMAYVVTPRGAAILLEQALPVVMHVDRWIGVKTMQHHEDAGAARAAGAAGAAGAAANDAQKGKTPGAAAAAAAAAAAGGGGGGTARGTGRATADKQVFRVYRLTRPLYTKYQKWLDDFGSTIVHKLKIKAVMPEEDWFWYLVFTAAAVLAAGYVALFAAWHFGYVRFGGGSSDGFGGGAEPSSRCGRCCCFCCRCCCMLLGRAHQCCLRALRVPLSLCPRSCRRPRPKSGSL